MNDKTLLEESIFKIGNVVSVSGRQVRVKVDKAKNTSHLIYKGEILRNVSVGGYIKIVKGFTSIVGKVDGEFTSEDKQFLKKGYGADEELINRELSVSLLGFFKENKFIRGIKELPLIDNECYLLQKAEFNQVHNFINPGDEPLCIGSLALEKGQKINLGINSLFASHIGIFGNTGSGKSYTLAKIYRQLFEKFKNNEKFKNKSRFFLIDFNGEYVSEADNVIVDKEFKEIFKLSTRSDTGDKFPIQEETLKEAEFWAIFLEVTEKTQMPFLRRALDNNYVSTCLENEVAFKELIDELIFAATTKDDKEERNAHTGLLSELSDCFDGSSAVIRTLLNDYHQNLFFHGAPSQRKFIYRKTDGTLIYSDNTNYRAEVITNKLNPIAFGLRNLSLIDVVRLKIIIQYYSDIIRGFANREHLAPLIKRLDKRIKDLKKLICVDNPAEMRKNITIISLRDVNLHTRKFIPLLLCKNLYEKKKRDADETTFLNLIIGEAHNILSIDSERESEQWKDYRLETFEEIIKEGRKFGVFLTIASQRPSDISGTILSQLHNYFLHRLINNNDIYAVERTISYLDKVSVESLSILPTGTCILAGLVAQVPVILEIDSIEEKYEPNNKTITLLEAVS